ncbi:MAG: histidine kinase dimerization/phosphoacceptor domain -containing protein [Thermodesulfobacteriota bacterium]|nr:histidine kinase dimerization/phosphoacceptor domain -containing protein [Thermodesulfobacteriota bacterium]
MIEKPNYEELEKRVQELEQAESKRKQAEDKLKATNQQLIANEKTLRVSEQTAKKEYARFKSILDTNPSGIYIVDKQYNIEYVNPVIEKEFGPINGRKCYSYFNNLSKSCEWCKNKEVFSGKSVRWEWFSKKNNKYYELFDTPIENPDGTISKFEILFDITERKQTEKALFDERQRLDGILRGTNVGTWEWNVQTGETIFNERWAEIIGYTLEEISPVSIETWIKYTHPDNLKVSNELLEKHFQGKLDYYECEAQMKHKNGDWVWVLDRGKVITWTEDGKPLMVMGTHLDITDRKKAEKALKYSRLQLEAVFNNIDSGIYIADMESHEILFINKHLKNDFGKDLTGQICWKSIHENQSGPCDFCTNDKLIDASGNPKEPYIWEIHNQKLNRWHELHDQAIPWTDGRLVRMEIAVDITERKISEMAVLQREQYLKALNRAAQLLLVPTDTIPFQEVVDEIGLASKASRVYIFINHLSSDNELLTRQKAEWCAKGITPEIDNPALQNLSYDKQLLYLKETLQRGDVFKGRVADLPDNERGLLEPQGILSILIIPIMIDNESIGFIGFDNCVSDSMWTPTEQTFLSMTADDIAQAIQRIDTQNEIQNALDEKVVLLREIHHRVKNNMQVIVSLLRMQSRRIKDENIEKVFEECRDRINAMSLVHESLYQSDNLSRIDFKTYLKRLCRNMSQAYGASGKGISLVVQECGVTLDMDQGIAIGMVIAELVSNAFKHAFPLGKGGNVSINLSELDKNNVQMIIKDDGKGIPPEIDIMNSPSLGLQLAAGAVTKELGGTIEVERDGGTQFTICFKHKRK